MPESLFNKTGNFIKKETVAKAFSYEFCEISKNTSSDFFYTSMNYLLASKLWFKACWLKFNFNLISYSAVPKLTLRRLRSDRLNQIMFTSNCTCFIQLRRHQEPHNKGGSFKVGSIACWSASVGFELETFPFRVTALLHCPTLPLISSYSN